MNSHYIKSLLTLSVLLIVILSVGCQGGKMEDPSQLFGDVFDGVFLHGTRPQTQNYYIAIVKLNEPALVQSLDKKNGKWVDNPEAQKALQQEQEEFIQGLKSVSKDIQIVYRYRMILNGLAISAPIATLEMIRSKMHISYLETIDGGWTRPQQIIGDSTLPSQGSQDVKEFNSVKFIGAEFAHSMKVKGKDGTMVPLDGTGMKVGVIDTGIDYTHSFFLGAGTEEAYKGILPNKKSDQFPNSKVVGGYDFCGTEYDSASADYSKRIPLPDDNPLDEGGHGSHVAGTIAGIGDNIETYSGVAPQAALYALKVFGRDGSTGDATVIAALEYAIDPNADGNPVDQLDVVNLSLGSPFGSSHSLYAEAVKNLFHSGTLVIASAGNSGDFDYVTGSPASVDEALSVAASIDNSLHNWNFSAVKFLTPSQPSAPIIIEAIESTMGKLISELKKPLQGKLVPVGLLDEDYTGNTLQGHVAFVDRGKVPFAKKLERAFQAGAIGVVVANNQPGEPISMGGDGHYDLPAIMISQSLADVLKKEMSSGEVSIDFSIPEKIQKPEKIDTITGFSSKGPRSFDSFFKPEISAPGQDIISAKMGGGHSGIKFSGTSMSAPHMTGAMTLLKQAYPDLNPSELKALAMGTSKILSAPSKERYPLSRQGAGRVQIENALQSPVLADKYALSYGNLPIATKKILQDHFTIKNIKDRVLKLNFQFESTSSVLSVDFKAKTVEIPIGGSVEVPLYIKFDVTNVNAYVNEVGGWIKIFESDKDIYHVPVFAVLEKISMIQTRNLQVQSHSQEDAFGALTQFQVSNKGSFAGDVLPFNLVGIDQRKADRFNDPYANLDCDLQALGYKIVDRSTNEGRKKFFQLAVKLYDPQTSWNNCEISVLLDQNEDQIPDQELAVLPSENIPGFEGKLFSQDVFSFLMDYKILREIRAKFEADSRNPEIPKSKLVAENYSPALLDLSKMDEYSHSTVQLVESEVSNLAKNPFGELRIKVLVHDREVGDLNGDDYFTIRKKDKWIAISTLETDQPFMDLPEKVTLKAQEAQAVSFKKGRAKGSLLLLYPHNSSLRSRSIEDSQKQILRPEYLL